MVKLPLVSRVITDMRRRKVSSKTLAAAVMMAAAAAWPQQVRAAPASVYTVANFQVGASEEDAVKAKNAAIAEGEEKAFRILLKRLTHYRDFQRLPDFRAKRIEILLDRFSVRREKNSRTEYFASLDFLFQPNAVQALLRENGISFIDAQAPQIVVVPVFLSADRRDQRAWQQVWKDLDLEHALTPVKLAKMSARLTIEKLSTVLSGDQDAFDEMTRQYSTRRLVFAIASPSVGGEKLAVRLIGRDAADKIDLSRSYSGFDPSLSPSEEAAVVSLAIFEGRWKAKRLQGGERVPDSEKEIIVATVEYSGLGEWNAIRERLGKIPGVGTIDIGSLSPRRAEITLTYPGGAPYLGRQLQSHNFSLENVNGAWIIRSF